MAQFLADLSRLFTLAFAVSSMFSMGLGLTVAEIIQPLRNLRLTALALVANFGVVPAAAFALGRLLGLQPDLQTGLLLVGSVAGAPLTVKLAQIARGNAAFAVSLVALLVIGTVIYLPLVMPLLLPGVRVSVLSIAGPLILQILLPLALGLFVRARYEEEAEDIRPTMGQIANISLALMLVLMLGLNLDEVFGLFGSGAILAIVLLIAIALVVGYVLGGPDAHTQRVLALGTGQRNLAAAFVVGAASFADRPDVLVLLAAAGLVAMIVMIPVAGEFGRRSKAAAEAEVGPALSEPVRAGGDGVGRP